PRTQAFPIEGIATLLALEQALQQIPGATGRLPSMALVLLQLLLYSREYCRLNERRDRDGNPVLGWDISGGDRTARLHRPVALSTQPGAQRALPCLAKGRGALIGRIFQDAPHHTAIPDRLARAGHLACVGESATDLPNRQAVVADPGKDLPDDAGLV